MLAPELIAVRQDEGEHAETITDDLLSIDPEETQESSETEDIGIEKLVEGSKSVSETESQIPHTEANEDPTDVDWNQRQEPEDDSWAVGW